MDTSRGNAVGLRRRSVVKGAAWAAPVVTLGVAAPLAAASPAEVVPSLGGGSCKFNDKGSKHYHVELVFSNGLNQATTVSISSLVVTTASGQNVSFPSLVRRFDVSARGSTSFEYDSSPVQNLANGSARITYTYTDGGGQAVGPESASLGLSLPPCAGNTADEKDDDKGAGSESTTPESAAKSSSTPPPDGSTTSTPSTNRKQSTTEQSTPGPTTPAEPAPTSTTPSN